MKSIRYFLLRILAGRTAVVLNTDVRFAGAGCHLENHSDGGGDMYIRNCTLQPLD